VEVADPMTQEGEALAYVLFVDEVVEAVDFAAVQGTAENATCPERLCSR